MPRMELAGIGLAGHVAFCVGVCLLATSCTRDAPSGAEGLSSKAARIRGRVGIIQGPLLMGEDFERELKEKASRPAEAGKSADAILDELSLLREPAEKNWDLSQWAPPEGAQVIAGDQVASGPFISYTPPLSLGCRTTGQGTGLARTSVDPSDRGKFDVLCVANPGCYGYTVSSPCLKYVSPGDGWVRVDFAVALIGRGRAIADQPGDAGLEVGLYAAHCWPKEQGKYWQEAPIFVDSTRRFELDGATYTMIAYFPVNKDQQYSFGTGLTTLAWAGPNSQAGLRLWGRELGATIRFLDKLPSGVRPPYGQ